MTYKIKPRHLLNLITGLLFLLLFLASHQTLATVLILGEVKMEGLSMLTTRFFRIVCILGGVLGLVSPRTIPFFGGATIAVLTLMLLGVWQDISDLGEYYPEEIDRVMASIKLSAWGITALATSLGVLALSLGYIVLAVLPLRPFSTSNNPR